MTQAAPLSAAQPKKSDALLLQHVPLHDAGVRASHGEKFPAIPSEGKTVDNGVRSVRVAVRLQTNTMRVSKDFQVSHMATHA